MKTSSYSQLGYLKKVYGSLPLSALMDDREKEGALDVGEFSVDTKVLIQAARQDDTVFDYLIGWYNQEIDSRRANLNAFKNVLPKEIAWRFGSSIRAKRETLKKFSSIKQMRLDYLALTPPPDEKKDSLATFGSQVALYKEELLAQIRPEFFFAGNKGFKALFPFGNRQRNVQILGGAGSGKSELIKLFLYSDIQHGKGCFLLDPHGDLAMEVAQFRSETDKILYLSPEFGKYGHYFRFNPLQHGFYDKPDAIKQAFISVKSQELLNAFTIVMGTEFSPNMERIIFNCLQVLLSHKGMNLRDFLRFLRPATSQPYEQLASQHYSETVRLFFAHDFNEKRLEITKASILTRFENSLANYHLAQIFDCKESSFDLQKSLNQGKCILFNCSQGILGESGSRLLGSFIMSELTTLALQKAKIPVQFRKPWMGYIDECQNYLTERIDKVLSEARKYALHLTLANQFLGQVQSPRLKDSILANTNIKCLGYSSYKDYEKMSKEMNFKGKQTPKLGKGRFIVKVGTYDPIVIQAYDFLVGKNKSHYLNTEQHRQRLNQNLQDYYTKSKKPTKAEKDRTAQTIEPKIQLPKIEKIL